MSNAAANVPTSRVAQVRQAYKVTKKYDPNIGRILLLVFLVVAGLVATGIYLWLGGGLWGIVLSAITSVSFGLLAAVIVFGRRAERSAYAQVEGQPGAAAGSLQMLRRGWTHSPAVAFTKNQDIVHRAVGRPGVVLVGEGNGHRVRALLASEKKKHARIVGEDVPVTEVVVGRGEGEVPLPKLIKHLNKLPKAVKPAQQTVVINKLRALDAVRPAAPIPHGAVGAQLKGARKAVKG